MKRKFAFLTMILLGFFSLFLFLKPNVKGKVNQQVITAEELLAYGEKNENKVAATFIDTHKISSLKKDFWQKDFAGKRPIDTLYQVAMNDLIKHKIILQTAEDLKIIKPLTPKEEKKQWQQKSKELMFWQYLDTEDTQLTDQIKTTWLNTQPPNKVQLKKAFEHLKDTDKKTDYSIEAIEITNYSGSVDELKKLAKTMDLSKNLKEVTNQWKKKLPESLISPFRIKSTETQKNTMYQQTLGRQLNGKGEGEIIVGNQENQFYYVVHKEGGRLLTLKEASELAKNQYINELYQERITNYQKQAKVKRLKQMKQKFINHYLSNNTNRKETKN